MVIAVDLDLDLDVDVAVDVDEPPTTPTTATATTAATAAATAAATPAVLPATPSREQRLRDGLFEAGFDIFHGPFSPVVYNNILESEGLIKSGVLSKLPQEIAPTTTSSTNGNAATRPTTAYLIGNTKHLWPIFLRWLQKENKAKHQELVLGDNDSDVNIDIDIAIDHTDGERILIEDPLDTYEQSAIRDVVERVCDCHPKDETNTLENTSSSSSSDTNRMLYWSSDLTPARMVSMARIASGTGFSYLDPHTHLSVHPTFGTWHSYRAVLLLPMEESEFEFESECECESLVPLLPRPTTPTLLPNPMSPLDRRTARDAFDVALETSTNSRNKGKGKSKTTDLTTLGEKGGETTTATTREESKEIGEKARSELSEELGRGNYKKKNEDDGDDEQDGQEASSNLRKQKVATAWIALRDAISIGRETHRFDENQLWYHYTKDPRYLLNGIQSISLENGSS
jgi:hypothetical protein